MPHTAAAATGRIKGPRAVEQSDDDDGDGGKSGESGEAAKAAAADNNTLREPIVLQHGMAANAAQWVMFGHGRSLGNKTPRRSSQKCF